MGGYLEHFPDGGSVVTVPSAFHARHKGHPREPAWSIKDFAADFGVPYRRLVAMIATMNDGCPKPEFRHTSRVHYDSYYKVSEMRKWWSKVKDRA